MSTEASGALILVTGVLTGVLIQKKYLTIPEKVPYLSLWYSFNIGSALDALFVIGLGGWKTNFFGFKPGELFSFSFIFVRVIYVLVLAFIHLDIYP